MTSRRARTLAVVPAERVISAIRMLRGQRVMLDSDLAVLYGVTTRRLNEQVRRNRDRFPADFMFELTANELANLKSQFATSSLEWGGRRKLPRAFTEHGAVMLASVLRSRVAVETSVHVVRAFIQLRQVLQSNAELARKLDALEQRYDSQFREVFAAIRELMMPQSPARKQIGFRTESRGLGARRARR